VNDSARYRDGVALLKGIAASKENDEKLRSLVEAQQQVLARYQPVFTPEGVRLLTAEEFRDFLMFRNNLHWSRLQRLGPYITADMHGLREALLELLDEEIPVLQRLDRLLPDGRGRVRKLHKAVLTPILLIAYPDRYGVWN